jgi:iron complex transport system ATP-binding protein
LRLQLDDIRWRADTREVLSGVGFAVDPGELVALMGRNGAGKSTLLDIIAGLRTPDAGEVRLDSRPLRAWTPDARARQVAHLPQSVRADLPFRAADLVLMGRYPHTDRWFESAADRDAVEQAMQRTHCWELRDRLANTLSGGERQRVLLAACLAQAPQLLLLDEPSTHLDIDQQLHCFSLLREETTRGATCVTVTHDLNLALAYATRLIVIADGRVAFDASTEAALRAPDWLPLFSSRLRLSGTSVSYA